MEHARAIDIDRYSCCEDRRSDIDFLLETGGPSLTSRRPFVPGEGEAPACGDHIGASYGVALLHPGVKLSSNQPGDEEWPKDIGAITLCIPAVIRRATAAQDKSIFLYLHDRSQWGEDAVFLGGAEIRNINESIEQQLVYDESTDLNTLTFLEEVDMHTLDGRLIHRADIQAANRVWTVTVLDVDGSYKTSTFFVWVGAGVVLAASVFLALWLYHSSKRAKRYATVLTAAQRSTAIVDSLFPKNVAKQMMDYDSNDQDGKNADIKSKPIADLFPETTVMFAAVSYTHLRVH